MKLGLRIAGQRDENVETFGAGPSVIAPWLIVETDLHRREAYVPARVQRSIILFALVGLFWTAMPGCRDKTQPELRYDAKTGRLQILFGSERLIDSVVAKPKLQRIEHSSLGSVWLVQFSRSDSCPSEYLALLPNGRTSEVFGNCSEFTEILQKADAVELVFADDEMTGRAGEKVTLR